MSGDLPTSGEQDPEEDRPVPELDPQGIEPEKFDWEHPEFRGQRRPGMDVVRPKPKWYRPRNTVLAPFLVLVLLFVGFVLYCNAQLSGIRRAPFLSSYAGPAGKGVNVLLVGSDTAPSSLAVDTSTMIVQLVHISDDGHQAAVVHLPRDLWLPTVGGTGKKAPAERTLSEAYAAGGNPALMETVARDLDVGIDHVVQVDFTGYADVTDHLGGVDLPTALGVRHFTGDQALRYTDAPGLPRGDIDNGKRNQDWLKAMLSDSITPGVLLNPVKIVQLLHASTPSLVVDDTFTTRDMRNLMWFSRHLRTSSIRYLTAPYIKFAHRTGERVLLPNAPALAQLGAALNSDDQAGIATFDN